MGFCSAEAIHLTHGQHPVKMAHLLRVMFKDTRAATGLEPPRAASRKTDRIP